MAAFSVFSGRILSEILSIYNIPLSEETSLQVVLKNRMSKIVRKM